MEKENTLYISDLDGTLLNKSAELSEYTIKTLNTLIAGGLSFTVATARSPATAGKILENLELRIPIVLMNGVLIFDIDDNRYIKIYKLQPETVAMVNRTLKSHDTTGFVYELKNGELSTYYESLERKPLRDFVEERAVRYNKTFRHTGSFEQISHDHIIYYTLIDLPERLQPVYDALATQSGLNMAMYADNYSRDLWYLELFSADASKQNAVSFLRETYGYDKIVGFGDNLNDLPMFKACDISVAVGNAKPEVSSAADYICDTNENNGVAKWLADTVTQQP